MTPPLLLHVALPVLDEEDVLASSVEQILAFVRSRGLSRCEFVIADNGSRDRTAEIGRALATLHAEVGFVQVPRRGFGLALKTAWATANAAYLGYMDIDLATDLAHFEDVYRRVEAGEATDLFLGSRLAPGARVYNRTLFREVASRAYNLWLRTRLGIGFSDATCGFKFVARDLWHRLAAAHVFSDDWFFVTQLAVRAEWAGARVRDLPVTWRDQPNSKSAKRFVALTRLYLKGVAELRRERAREQRSALGTTAH